MTIKKRFALIVSLFLMITILFPAAKACADTGDPAMTLGSSILGKHANTELAQILYYGTDESAIPWYVIGYNGQGNSAAARSGLVTLLAKTRVGYATFNTDRSKGNAYYGSEVQVFLDNWIDSKNASNKSRFKGEEKAAISERLLEGGSGNKGTGTYNPNKSKGQSTIDQLWLLSTAEAEQLPDALRQLGNSNSWWLRTPGEIDTEGTYITSNGYIISQSVSTSDLSVRPAFDLKMDSVLFTSAFEGGKISGSVGSSALKAVGFNRGVEWKVTLESKDLSRNFSASANGCTTTNGTITIQYSTDQAGYSGRYISAIIVDSSGKIKYYGRIRNLSTSQKTDKVYIDLDGKRADGDKLYVFQEIYNEVGTDFSSKLIEIPMPTHSYSWTTTKAATTTEEGIEKGHCSKCGDEITRTIAKLPVTAGTSDSSGTGGSSSAGSSSKESATTVEQQVISARNDKDLKGSTFALLQPKASKVTKNKIVLGWKKVKGAAEYVVYANKCGKSYKVAGKTTKTSYTLSKLKAGKYYKTIIVAVGSDGWVLAKSKTIHIATKGSKNGNAKTVKANRKTVTVKVKKTITIKAKQTAESGTKISQHRKLAYESSNPKVAIVSGSGKVKGVGKGTCYIYVYAQNGVFAKVKVKVGI